jgi:hypothetical protein
MIYQDDDRFMIDTTTYKRMHPPEPGKTDQLLNDELGTEVMERDEPPEGNFVLLLPPTIYGFNMQEKTWSKQLRLDNPIFVN